MVAEEASIAVAVTVTTGRRQSTGHSLIRVGSNEEVY
jgi:hypothetical protein